MIRLVVSKVIQPLFTDRDRAYRLDDEEHYFENMQEAQEWLRETYGERRRRAMYNGTRQVGYVISLRVEDHNEEHWIAFFELRAITPYVA
jgi:hypothetical protein